MEVFHDLTDNIMYDLQGRIMAKNPIPSIDLMLQDNQFPPRHTTANIGTTRFQTSGENTIYIDFGDGSPIFSETFSGNKQYSSNDPIHIYDNTDIKTAKIWFEFPQRITNLSIIRNTYIGAFPLNLGLYNLEYLLIRLTRFETFPINFLGGVFNRITIENITQQTIYSIPQWITNSRIQDLSLHGGIELDNDATDSIENLMDIQDLATLSLAGTKITDIPSNFKDISTLRSLRLGNNPFTEITQNVNDCKQITELSFGYHANGWTAKGSNLFTSWGVGIVNMPELQVFRFDHMEEAPDTLPLGIEDAPKCKTIWSRRYISQERQDNFVDNVYNQVVSTASIATGDGVLRRTTLRMERFGGGAGALIRRPSGIYQAPVGYIQGVSNGTPATAMEMIYVLVNQYEWTLYVTDEAGTGVEILTP